MSYGSNDWNSGDDSRDLLDWVLIILSIFALTIVVCALLGPTP